MAKKSPARRADIRALDRFDSVANALRLRLGNLAPSLDENLACDLLDALSLFQSSIRRIESEYYEWHTQPGADAPLIARVPDPEGVVGLHDVRSG